MNFVFTLLWMCLFIVCFVCVYLLPPQGTEDLWRTWMGIFPSDWTAGLHLQQHYKIIVFKATHNICGVHGWEYSLLIGPQVHTYNNIIKLLYLRQHIKSVAYMDGNIPF